jgi:DNA-binding MarR family transcriptional regulator
VPIDQYVFDVLLRDLVGHDKRPAAFLVYLHLYVLAARRCNQPIAASLREIAFETGLSKSAVQSAILALQRRGLIETASAHRTATPRHRVLRPWAVP